ncbi:MAG TPA: AMP-dependent synthetase/ligase [Alphaproteobacteria bacterium]|nr:AMP-dependent synthetase/ligase [Alphaproteobacteria bacterium]
MTTLADYHRWPTLTAMFFEQAERHGGRPVLWAKRDRAYQPTSWTEAARQVRLLARALADLGVGPGDRVAIVSENRPEWCIADFAVMAAGGISVPVYTTNTVGDHVHVLNDSGCKGAIVSKPQLFNRLISAALQAPEMRFIVPMDPVDITDLPAPHDGGPAVEVVQWDLALRRGEAAPDIVAARQAAAGRDDTACLIYTSGTGGAPKGVMLSHRAIFANCLGATDLLNELGLDPHEVFLCALPLSHAYEHSAGQMWPLSIGAEIYYAEGIETLAANLQEVRPTLMTAVPRLYEVLHQRLARQMAREPARSQRFFQKTLDLGRKRYQQGRLNPIDWAMEQVLDRLVRAKVRKRFGGRLKAMVSGGAPLNFEVGLFFHSLGLTILQGYGQTEAAPVISCNRPAKIKIETVGPPLREVELRIAEDGEILVRGNLLMTGYWNNPTATDFAVRDGWLHTGDVGHLDADGYLVITDRKKDIIVNSGGDNVSPARVEGFLTLEPEIGQAVVFGDRRPYLVGLVVPEAEFVETWAKANGKPNDPARLADDPDFRKAVTAAVERVNRAKLSNIERVRRFHIVGDAFTIQNGLMTPTLKLRRHAIAKLYGDTIDGLYGRE